MLLKLPQGISPGDTFVCVLSLYSFAVGEMTSFNVALKEGEIIIYIDNCDTQLFPCLLHMDFICVEQMNLF